MKMDYKVRDHMTLLKSRRVKHERKIEGLGFGDRCEILAGEDGVRNLTMSEKKFRNVT